MSAEALAQKLLNRTRYAQNRTKYYTVRNLILSQNERPLFVTGSFEEASKDRKLLAIKKAFVNRHYHRRGPFGTLSLPHVYSGIYGDPAYFSLEELVEACTSAAKSDMRDVSFWKQICEKLRKVRDILEIGDLLKCLSSIVKVNYYDPDLLRMLSREFVDDMDKLDLEQISTLLHCYYKQNVYSCDLIDTAGRVSIALLDKIEDPVVVKEDESSQDTGIFGLFRSMHSRKQPDKPIVSTHKYLSGIAKYLTYFGYNNPELFVSITRVLIAHQHTIDLLTKSTTFSSINPVLFIQAYGSLEADGGNNTLEPTTRARIVALMECIRNEVVSRNVMGHENDVDEYDMGLLLSSNRMSKETAKLVYDLCRVSSTIKCLSKMALRYIDNLFILSLVDKREMVDIDELWPSNGQTLEEDETSHRMVLGEIMAKLSECIDELVSLNVVICGEASGRDNEGSVGDANLPSVKRGNFPENSPYLVSIRCIFMDSLLVTMAVVNSFWRLASNASVYFKKGLSLITPKGQAKVLKFTLEDQNVHTFLHDKVLEVQVDRLTLEIVGKVAEQIRAYGCSGQSVQNLTNAFETLCISKRLGKEYKEGIEKVSREIIKQLVTFDRESIYRIKLAMNGNVKDEYLEYYINQFPRFTRLNKRKHRMTFSDPWTHFINVFARA